MITGLAGLPEEKIVQQSIAVPAAGIHQMERKKVSDRKCPMDMRHSTKERLSDSESRRW